MFVHLQKCGGDRWEADVGRRVWPSELLATARGWLVVSLCLEPKSRVFRIAYCKHVWPNTLCCAGSHLGTAWLVDSPDEPYDHVLILSIVSGRLSSKLRLRISKPFSSGYGRQCLPRHVRCLRCRVYRISRRLKLPWSGMAEGWLSSSGIWKLSISIQS